VITAIACVSAALFAASAIAILKKPVKDKDSEEGFGYGIAFVFCVILWVGQMWIARQVNQ
jgi:hypothetical protein